MKIEEAREQLKEWWMRGKHAHTFGCQVVDNSAIGSGVSLKIHLQSEKHTYCISARPPTDGDAGYLGCVASNRFPDPGEDWLRGSDLADGVFSEATWNEILSDIVSYEMTMLSDFVSSEVTLKRD